MIDGRKTIRPDSKYIDHISFEQLKPVANPKLIQVFVSFDRQAIDEDLLAGNFDVSKLDGVFEEILDTSKGYRIADLYLSNAFFPLSDCLNTNVDLYEKFAAKIKAGELLKITDDGANNLIKHFMQEAKQIHHPEQNKKNNLSGIKK